MQLLHVTLFALPLIASAGLVRRQHLNRDTISLSNDSSRLTHDCLRYPVATTPPYINETTSNFAVATPEPPLRPTQGNGTVTATATQGTRRPSGGVPDNGRDYMPPKS